MVEEIDRIKAIFCCCLSAGSIMGGYFATIVSIEVDIRTHSNNLAWTFIFFAICNYVGYCLFRAAIGYVSKKER